MPIQVRLSLNSEGKEYARDVHDRKSLSWLVGGKMSKLIKTHVLGSTKPGCLPCNMLSVDACLAFLKINKLGQQS